MKKATFLVFILAGLVSGCNTDALQSELSLQDDSLEYRDKKFVPFKGKADWVSSSRQGAEGRCAGLNPIFATILFEATGEISHMGKVIINGSQCVDQTGTVMSPLAIVDALITLTAANGDKVNMTGAGGLIPTANPLVFEVAVDFTIIGGTGRFKYAEGQGQIGGSVTFPNFPPKPGDPAPKVHNIYDGLIAY